MLTLHRLLAVVATGVLIASSGRSQGYVQRFSAGIEALDAGDLDTARRAFEAALEHGPENPTCAFYLACVEARAGRVELAFEWLTEAVERGYTDDAMLRWEPDLEAVRELPGFEPLLTRAATASHASAPARAARRRGGRPRAARLARVPDGRHQQDAPAGLQEAGIALEDAQGRHADLHAMRSTLATWLAREGVTPEAARRIMRHADVRTTLRHYTRLGLDGPLGRAGQGRGEEGASPHCHRKPVTSGPIQAR